MTYYNYRFVFTSTTSFVELQTMGLHKCCCGPSQQHAARKLVGEPAGAQSRQGAINLADLTAGAGIRQISHPAESSSACQRFRHFSRFSLT